MLFRSDYVSKDELFSRSDYISVHLVLSDRSRGLIGAADIAKMKKTAVLINTSRGPIIDEKAMLAALREKRIGGAGLDVYDIEPLPDDHELRRLDNAFWWVPGTDATTEAEADAYLLRGRAPDDRAFGVATLQEVLEAFPTTFQIGRAHV